MVHGVPVSWFRLPSICISLSTRSQPWHRAKIRCVFRWSRSKSIQNESACVAVSTLASLAFLIPFLLLVILQRQFKSKKGQKKKVVDVMTKKDWYDVKAPSYFSQVRGNEFSGFNLHTHARTHTRAHTPVKHTEKPSLLDKYLNFLCCLLTCIATAPGVQDSCEPHPGYQDRL